MAQNKFLPFAQGSSANVMSDADYASSLATNGSFATGVTTGRASSKQANKTWRQSSLMAAVLGQIIADYGLDANDSQSVATLEANFLAALQKVMPGRLLGPPIRFNSSGTYTPSAAARIARVRGVGAGGPGGFASSTASGYLAAGGAGGAGGEAEFWISLTGVTSIPVTVGSPAIQGQVNVQSVSGSSSFGDYVTLGGGYSGATGAATTSSAMTLSAAPGGAQIGNAPILQIVYAKSGATGQAGFVLSGQTLPGYGPSTSFGSSSPPSANGQPGDGTGYGSGGTGGGSSSNQYGNYGGRGGPAVWFVEEYT